MQCSNMVVPTVEILVAISIAILFQVRNIYADNDEGDELVSATLKCLLLIL